MEDYVSPARIYERLISMAFYDGQDAYVEFFTEDYYCSPKADVKVLSSFVFCALTVLCQKLQKSKFEQFRNGFKMDCSCEELDFFLKEIETTLTWND